MRISSVIGKILALGLISGLVIVAPLFSAADTMPPSPSPKDKCPVCGMFAAKYPDWVGVVAFRDGTKDFFDGAKDLFKYYYDLKKYRPEKSRADIESIHVTEYYDMKSIKAQDAFFVIGSDVFGPMGKELIPFAGREDAETFLKDHHGTRILRFDDIKPAILETLD